MQDFFSTMRLALLTALLAGFVSQTPLAADNGGEPKDSILILHNDRVMRGKITGGKDSYLVVGPSGRVFVPLEQVRFQCETLPEAYRKLLDGLPDSQTAASHMALARWCLENKLISEARIEMRTALELEPDREEARLGLRRIDNLLNPALKPAVPAEAPRRKYTYGDLNLQEVESLGGLSREQALRFTTRIQPILMNNCATGGCHGPKAENEFRLAIVRSVESATRHLAETNLAAVLRYVDQEDPVQSRLLTVPKGSHGARGRTLFQGARGSSQAKELQQWVLAISEPKAAEKTGVAKKGSGSSRTLGKSGADHKPEEGLRDPFAAVLPTNSPRRTASASPAVEDAEPPAKGPAPKTRKSASPAEKGAAAHSEPEVAAATANEPDAFDPEKFNSQTRTRQARR